MITELQLIQAIRDIAAASPDFIYDAGPTSCFYRPTEDMSTGCIVGRALTALGVPDELLDRLDEAARNYQAVGWALSGAVQVELLKDWLTPEALYSRWVGFMQETQDRGVSWGECVRQADEKALAEGWVRG